MEACQLAETEEPKVFVTAVVVVVDVCTEAVVSKDQFIVALRLFAWSYESTIWSSMPLSSVSLRQSIHSTEHHQARVEQVSSQRATRNVRNSAAHSGSQASRRTPDPSW